MCFRKLRKYIPLELLDRVSWLQHEGEQVALPVQISSVMGAHVFKQDLHRWAVNGGIELVEVGGIRFVTRSSLAEHINRRNHDVLTSTGGAK